MLDDVHTKVKNRHLPKCQAGQKNVKTQCTRRDNRGFVKELYFNPGIYIDEASGETIVMHLSQGFVSTDRSLETAVAEPSTKKTKLNRGDRRPQGDFLTSEK